MYWVHVVMSKANGRTGTGSKFRKRSASTIKVILKLKKMWRKKNLCFSYPPSKLA